MSELTWDEINTFKAKLTAESNRIEAKLGDTADYTALSLELTRQMEAIHNILLNLSSYKSARSKAWHAANKAQK